MKHYPQQVKQALVNTIQESAQCAWLFSMNPGVDFTRKRKLNFEQTVLALLGLEGKSIANELLTLFKCSTETPSPSAFVQQRNKLAPWVMSFLFHEFTSACDPERLYRGYRLLAVDGSDVQLPTNPNELSSYYPGATGQTPYNLLHMNAMYDLCSHLYVDAILEGKRTCSEHRTLVAMAERSKIPDAIILADRGYESFNNMAHLQEKGWKYLIRVKDSAKGISSGLILPEQDQFDVNACLRLTKKQTAEAKKLCNDKNRYRFIPSNVNFDYLPKHNDKYAPMEVYELSFRIVRFKITEGNYETVITNLDAERFPALDLKLLYSLRWGIETSFRDLKYTIGLLHFHAKKVEHISQEIFARLIVYNFSELITCHAITQKKCRKYAYKVNFSAAVHICRQFFRGNVSPPNVEALIARYVLPVRPGRSRPRKPTAKAAISFLYRVA